MRVLILLVVFLLSLPTLAEDFKPVSSDQLDGGALVLPVGKIAAPADSLWYPASKDEQGEAYVALNVEKEQLKSMIVVLNRGMEEPTLEFASGLVMAMSEGAEEERFDKSQFQCEPSQYKLIGTSFQFAHSKKGQEFTGFISVTPQHTLVIWNYGPVSAERFASGAQAFTGKPGL